MSVIGTAGHIDHGKSTLVKALSGIDPDRLAEEKNRGMTIDLGFAWIQLPSGREASVVDVPGHEGFIKNMLAGVGGIDLALLIVAADDGVMPQTREHLAILDLLQVKQGLIVVTKKDLVDSEWLELVVSDIEEAVKPTFLFGAPILPVSAVSGEGLQELVSNIDEALNNTPPKRDIARPRLPIDRAFTVSGFGTVVTGTLTDGQLSVGQEVAVVPGSGKARIRGLQTHQQKVATALPGSRVAVNLTGVSVQELERGKILTRPGWLMPTMVMDTKITLIPEAESSLIHGAGVMVHLLASQVSGRVRLLDSDVLEPGQTGYAQIRLAYPLAACLGDRFIIRNGAGTIGGGEIVDVRPKRHRRFHSPTLDTLAAVSAGTESMLLSLLAKHEPCEYKDLAGLVTLPADETRSVILRQIETGSIVCFGNDGLDARSILVTSKGWNDILARSEEALKAYHQQYPLRSGMPAEEMRSRLKYGARIALRVVEKMTRDGRLVHENIVEDNNMLRLESHQVKVSAQHQATIDSFMAAIHATPTKPPTDLRVDTEIITYLIEQGKIVRLMDELILSTPVFDDMIKRILDKINKDGQASLVEVRDMLDTTRPYAFALLEHLDHNKLAKRVGSSIIRM